MLTVKALSVMSAVTLGGSYIMSRQRNKTLETVVREHSSETEIGQKVVFLIHQRWRNHSMAFSTHLENSAIGSYLRYI